MPAAFPIDSDVDYCSFQCLLFLWLRNKPVSSKTTNRYGCYGSKLVGPMQSLRSGPIKLGRSVIQRIPA